MKTELAAAFAVGAVCLAGAAVSPPVESTQVVSAPSDGYCGWPTVSQRSKIS